MDAGKTSDVVIIGAGPAGLSAAIYACRAGKSVLLLEAEQFGGQIVNTPDVENYPGIKKISGFDFAYGLYEQATALGATVEFDRAIAIVKNGTGFTVKGEQAEYGAKAVIIATGAKNRHLGLDAEQKFVGRGVSYCATCDGAFFKGKTVAVNGGGNTAVEDAKYLSGICGRVYVIHRRDQFRADEKSVEFLASKPNVEFVLNSTVTDLIGDEGGKLEAIEVTDKLSGEKKKLEVSALFVAIGQVPDNKAFDGEVRIDDKGYVKGGEDCLTGTDGIYVAGDCRTKSVRQLTTAAADGAVAGLAAATYAD